MSDPFLAEVRMVGFNFAPRGWAFCDGQILPINQNQSLYSLLGTIYGGDGRTSFALPDLRGRTPIHPGDIIQQGQRGGEETVTLNEAEMPNHTHELVASNTPAIDRSVNNDMLAIADNELYATASNLTSMASTSISNTGGNQSHDNNQPSTVINFCIALQGLFPSRN